MASVRKIMNQLMRAGFTLVSIGDIIGRIEGYQNSLKLLRESGMKETDNVLVELKMRVLDNVADFLEQAQKVLSSETTILSKDLQEMVSKITELVDNAKIAREKGEIEKTSEYIEKASEEIEKFDRDIRKPLMVLLESKEREFRKFVRTLRRKQIRRGKPK